MLAQLCRQMPECETQEEQVGRGRTWVASADKPLRLSHLCIRCGGAGQGNCFAGLDQQAQRGSGAALLR